MRSRTIKMVLRNKFNSWVDSISDPKLQELVKRDAIVTGGCIASMLLGEEINDYDMYFTTKETVKAVASYYVGKFKENPPSRFKKDGRVIPIFVNEDEEGRISIVVKSAGIAGEDGTKEYKYFEQVSDDVETEEFVENTVQDATEATDKKSRPKYRPVFLTSNAITLSDKIQLVLRFYGPVNEIHENYDFVHCKCSWEASSGKLILPPESLEALLGRELRYTTSKYPLCSIIRTRKFISKGWKIHAGQYVKMAWDLNRLDLSNPNVLRDQMVGVDAAYFGEVLRLLQEKDADKVDGTYLMQVIDKVFG